MSFRRIFLYTVLAFLTICVISYIANAQSQQLSLKEAVSLAINNNREVKVARLDVDRSAEQVRIAKSVSLPSAGIGAQVGHYFSAPAFFGFDGDSHADKVSYARFGGKDQAIATLSVVQPLINTAARPGIQRSRLEQSASRINVAGREADIAASVKQTYLQLLVLKERINLQQESLNRNQKALEDSRSLLAQGRALRVDTLRAYTSVKNLEPDLLQLSNAIEVGKLQLKTLLGIDSLRDIQLSDSLALPPARNIPTEEEVYGEAGKTRADLQVLALQPQINDQQIKLAAAAMKPTVNLVGQYQLQTQVNRFNYFNGYYPSTPFLGAQLVVPIFSGFSNAAKLSQARIEKKQSVIQLSNAYEELKAEVRQVVSALRETSVRLQTRTNVKETAQLSYDITQYRYARGVASRLELTDAELALTAAQSNYLEAVYDYLSARIALDRTIGRVGD